MTGVEYAKLIAAYLLKNYGDRGIEVYREVSMGKSIIGKNRKVDIVVRSGDRILAIECKYQETQGTTDEKIPYAIQDMEAMWIPGVVVYAGSGWSPGVEHLLRSAKHACSCLPDAKTLRPSAATRELDHVLAAVFGWWDLFLDPRRRFDLSTWDPPEEQGDDK